MKKLIQALYDSEINLEIKWVWDSGFDIRIGDKMNGFVHQFYCDTVEEMEQQIETNVKKYFPKFNYTKDVGFSLFSHSDKLELLGEYTKFLQKEGYIDADATSEEPFAVDEFLRKSHNV